MSQKVKLRLIAILMCLGGWGIFFGAFPVTVIQAFLSICLQIHGVALFAKSKGRHLYWGLFCIYPVLGCFIGLVLLVLLKEKKQPDSDVPMNAGLVTLGLVIIVVGLISSLSVEQRNLGYDNPDYHPTTLFASIAIFGYGFYLGGLNKFLTSKRLGIE